MVTRGAPLLYLRFASAGPQLLRFYPRNDLCALSNWLKGQFGCLWKEHALGGYLIFAFGVLRACAVGADQTGLFFSDVIIAAAKYRKKSKIHP